MLTSIITAIIAYISTNIDDIFVLMILLTQAKGKRSLVAGHFLGVALLTVISILGAIGLQNFPLKYMGILGLVPIGLGIRMWFHRNDEETAAKAVDLVSMAMITLGNGSDNLGVYIPLFTGFSGTERVSAAAIFLVMTALWVFLANALAEFPKIKTMIETYKDIVIPIIFIILGLFIFWDSEFLR